MELAGLDIHSPKIWRSFLGPFRYNQRSDLNGQMLLTHNTQSSIFLSKELIVIHLSHLFGIKRICSAVS
jgi:hypothetical protein